MSNQPNSQLTTERPDIWDRAIALATSVTGLEYAHKAPLPDGTIYACGGGGGYYRTPTPHEIIISKIDNINREIYRRQQIIENYQKPDPDPYDSELWRYRSNIEDLKEQRDGAHDRNIPTPDLDKTIADYEIGLPAEQEAFRERRRVKIDNLNKEIEELRKERSGYSLSPVHVPDGAMEWLLHEVGHWVASTPNERRLPNYGYGIVKQKGWGKEREWQAWAFEEIIMAPFGPSRGFAPAEHRGGTAFDGPGHQLIPEEHLRRANAQIKASGTSIEQWRTLYGEWVRWGNHKRIFSSLNH